MKRVKIPRIDKFGHQLFIGDIITDCTVGESTWDGQGIIRTRPLGIIREERVDRFITNNNNSAGYECTKGFGPEECDFYYIERLREGYVQLTDKAFKWLNDNSEKGFTPIYIETINHDRTPDNWCNFERIGSIYDLDNAEFC